MPAPELVNTGTLVSSTGASGACTIPAATPGNRLLLAVYKGNVTAFSILNGLTVDVSEVQSTTNFVGLLSKIAVGGETSLGATWTTSVGYRMQGFELGPCEFDAGDTETWAANQTSPSAPMVVTPRNPNALAMLAVGLMLASGGSHAASGYTVQQPATERLITMSKRLTTVNAESVTPSWLTARVGCSVLGVYKAPGTPGAFASTFP